MLFIDAKKLENEIKKKEYINDCSVTWKLFGLEMEVDEIAAVFQSRGKNIVVICICHFLFPYKKMIGFIVSYP